MYKLLSLLALTSLLFVGCGEKKDEEKKPPGMKCGAGKCGANMFDGNAALVKKKKNILSQMREDDPRKNCVKKAPTTKDMYNCVRDPKGNKLILKCGAGKCGDDMKSNEPAMKCGAGKCGAAMQAPKPTPKKEEPAMKCGEGKCGNSM